MEECYQRDYRLRYSQRNTAKGSVEVTFPMQVVDKEARKRKLSVEEFIKKFKVVAKYNGFEGVLYTFEEIQ